MPLSAPTPPELRAVARELGFSLTDTDLETFRGLLEETVAAYDVVDRLPDELPPVRYPRTPGHEPREEENPHNAWYVRTTIEGAPDGPLAGKRVAIKDNVCVAGVPMMAGASTLEGYVPEVDATIVSRILDAGGTILGKAHCEYFCLSGSSHTGARGAVHNPWRRGYSAGGSSSGSAVLVASGDADMAIGGDQGGSIRIPASMCGVVGLKPTYGLVPYTGVMPIELTLDHVGTDDRDRRRQRPDAPGDRGRRRARPAPVRAPGRVLRGRARSRGRRAQDRGGPRRLRAVELRCGGEREGSGRSRGIPAARSGGGGLLAPDAFRSGRRSGPRSASKGSPP